MSCSFFSFFFFTSSFEREMLSAAMCFLTRILTILDQILLGMIAQLYMAAREHSGPHGLESLQLMKVLRRLLEDPGSRENSMSSV